MNSALARLGDARIETTGTGEIDLDDELTQTVVDVYGFVRDAFLDKYPWSAAQQTLVLRTEAVAGELMPRRVALAYPWVHDIRSVHVAEPDGRGGIEAGAPITFEWTARGGYLLTGDYAQVVVVVSRGLAEESTTRLMDEALVLQLVADLCFGRTFDTAATNLWQRRADRALEIAQRVDSQSQPAQTLPSYRLEEARVGGYGQGGRITSAQVDFTGGGS